MKIYFVLMLFMLSFSLGYGQTKSDTAQVSVFKKHSIQFRINGMFELSSFKGGLISYKYHFNDKGALRISINYSANTIDGNDRYERYNNTTTEFFSSENYISFSGGLNQRILASAEYMFYFKTEEEIKVFIGIGPEFGYDTYNFDSNNSYYIKDKIDNENINTNDRDTYLYGITSSIGVEWFFYKNIMSLHADYSFDYLYFTGSSGSTSYNKYYGDDDNIDKSKSMVSSDISGYNFISNGVRLGLSVYF